MEDWKWSSNQFEEDCTTGRIARQTGRPVCATRKTSGTDWTQTGRRLDAVDQAFKANLQSTGRPVRGSGRPVEETTEATSEEEWTTSLKEIRNVSNGHITGRPVKDEWSTSQTQNLEFHYSNG